MKKILLFLPIFICLLFSNNIIKVLPYKTNEFSPILNQKFKIEYNLTTDANVTMQIYTPDNNLIREIKKDSKKGLNTIFWDGKDNKGEIVPNEAYSTMFIAKTKDKNETLDFRFTGGEVLKALNTKVDRKGNIFFYLEKPARILVRAGIENGPMLKVIANWVPKNKGFIKLKWNMKDKDNLIDISKLDFGVSVSAFSLPKMSIITTNNNKIDYYTYIKKNNLKCNLSQLKKVLKRGDKAISKHFYRCRKLEKDPKISIIFSKSLNNENNISINNGDEVDIKVTMNKNDEDIFNQTKYEVTFFIDMEFASEEELGFMPISWRYVPNGLSKGKHILTVNISSFTGEVGLKSIPFYIK